MHSNDKSDFCRVIERIAARYIQPYGTDGIARMAKLLVTLKQIEWTVSLGNEAAAAKVWAFLQTAGIDMDWIRSMVSEFLFHSDYHYQREDLVNEIAASITWINTSLAVPSEYQKLSASEASAKAVLMKAPWLVFLYLLHASDVVHQVSMKGELR